MATGLPIDTPTGTKTSIILHVEARLLPTVIVADRAELTETIAEWLHESFDSLSVDQEITSFDGTLERTIERMSVTEVTGSTSEILALNEVKLSIHVYQLYVAPFKRALQRNEDDAPTSRVTELPSPHLEGIWESLVFDPDIKSKLLRFISTLLLFVEKNVSFVSIGFNRLILLFGPPGSGKTSLCRALAQKLSIRLSKEFFRHKLIEINSHNLFSKYFSESGKIVVGLFEEILDLLTDSNLFVTVLIDEVETLVCSRKAAANGNEPTDGLRVVTALLTSLDKLRSKKNVIVITTSNLVQAMDPAFLDRADITQFVDLPKTPAIYTIFRNSFNELIRAGVILNDDLIPCAAEASLCLHATPYAPSSRLWQCSMRCWGLSGRKLSKIPVLMHADYIQRKECSLGEALDALDQTVGDELKSRDQNNGDRW
ncbi:pachytene checkpoint component Pch2 [Geopyxis carbonaria]|nr:pachytene checkpoint component Pch2 [Geopyxis carbonaria]